MAIKLIRSTEFQATLLEYAANLSAAREELSYRLSVRYPPLGKAKLVGMLSDEA